LERVEGSDRSGVPEMKNPKALLATMYALASMWDWKQFSFDDNNQGGIMDFARHNKKKGKQKTKKKKRRK